MGRRSSPAAQERLVRTVEQLQAEVDGLRQAMRARALIEQAKGLVAGRLGCTPDAAFDRFTAISQKANVKVLDLAAELLGATVPVMANPDHQPSVAPPDERWRGRPPRPAEVAAHERH